MAGVVPSKAERLLTSEPLMAHLATSVDDRPHVAPVWYGYEDDTVEVLTTGRKLENARRNPRVALSVQKDEGGRTEWMVTLQGTANVIGDGDGDASRAAAERIYPKYGADPGIFPENVLVRIDVGTASYRTY